MHHHDYLLVDRSDATPNEPPPHRANAVSRSHDAPDQRAGSPFGWQRGACGGAPRYSTRPRPLKKSISPATIRSTPKRDVRAADL